MADERRWLDEAPLPAFDEEDKPPPELIALAGIKKVQDHPLTEPIKDLPPGVTPLRRR